MNSFNSKDMALYWYNFWKPPVRTPLLRRMTNQPRSLKKIWDKMWPENLTYAHFRCFLKQVSWKIANLKTMHNWMLELPKWHPCSPHSCSPYCVASLEFYCHKNMHRGTNKHPYLSTSSATNIGGVELRNFDEQKTGQDSDSERATMWYPSSVCAI